MICRRLTTRKDVPKLFHIVCELVMSESTKKTQYFKIKFGCLGHVRGIIYIV